MRKILLIAGLFALALAACGGTPTGGQPPAADNATSPPAVEQPAAAGPAATPAQPTAAPATPQPTAAPEPTGVAPQPGAGGTSIRPPDDLVGAAQQQLAVHLKQRAADLPMQSANFKEWPDGALGCPKPGVMYPQVVTPGFLLVFTNPSQTQSYQVHTARTAAQMVLCENGQPVDLSGAPGAAPDTANPASPAPSPGDASLDAAGQRMAGLALAALAKDLGVGAADVTLVSAEQVEWNDSSLGCPQPGQ
ncbi:MAG TPA: hypothetical protein VF897_14580, partial [Roseiflexaceae bacterium]